MDFVSNFSLLSNSSLFGNSSACEYVDVAIDAVVEMRNVTVEHIRNPTGITASAIIITISLPFIFYGARLFRFVSAISVGLFVFYLTYNVSENSSNLSCDAQLAISSVLGLICAIATGCLIKLALFFLGAIAFGSVTHIIFTAFPQLNDIYEVPTVAGKSLIYWGGMLISIFFGGLMVKYNKDFTLEIATSAVGAFGFVYGLHGLTELTDVDLNHWVFFGIGIATWGVGFYTQRMLRKRRKMIKKKSEEK